MTRRVYQTPFVLRPPADLPAARPALSPAASDLLGRPRDLAGAAAGLARLYGDEARAAAGPRVVVTEPLLAEVGHALWVALAAADPGLPARLAEARAAAGPYVLPLIVESASPAVQLLPWEALRHPDYGFLGLDRRFALSRRVPGPAPAAGAPDHEPLRVVMFTCLPDDLDPERARLDVEEQQARALEAFGGPVADGLARLAMPDDGRFSTFQALISDFDPHLVFLFAHGRFNEPLGGSSASYAELQFEAEGGGSDFVRDDRLAAAFAGSGIQCVVVAACESGKGDSGELAAGVAWRLSRDALVPHVLGMRETVLERAGIAFNAAFGAAVVAGERVDVALQLGRAAITAPLAGAAAGDPALAGLSRGQWALPALISADPARPLIDWTFAPDPPEPVLTRNPLGDVLLGLPPRFIGRRRD